MSKGPPPGWLYVLSSPAMPGLLKVGHTVRDPKTRALELADATGVPCSFIIEYTAPTPNSEKMEGIVHRMLGDRRPSPNREFFLCTVAEAKAAIAAALAGKKPPKEPPPLAVQLPRGWRPPVAPAKRLASDRAGQIKPGDVGKAPAFDPESADFTVFEEAASRWKH